MVDLATKRVVARWVSGAASRELKKLSTWAKKLDLKIQLAARQVKGVDPDDWDRSFGPSVLWAPGAGPYDYGSAPIGYEFEAMMSTGYVQAKVRTKVLFEDGGSKRYRVETEVRGKKLPTVEKTGRRLKATDFFKPLQSYILSHQDELITPETEVWHSEDPSGNMYFGLTQGVVDWREAYIDGITMDDPPWSLEEWGDKTEKLQAEEEAEVDALYEAAEAADEDVDESAIEALRQKYRPKLNALVPAFQTAVEKWIDSEWWGSEKVKLKDRVKDPRVQAQVIEDLKATGSAGL